MLRLADLSGQPGGLYPDEAAEGLDAHRLLTEPGFHPLFFHDDAGREALFGYLVAAAFRVFGESTTVLRGTAAMLGVLGVLALWPALRRFGTGTALAGMAWAAGSLWLVTVARDGFRVILVPLAGALAMAALLRWNDRRSRGAAALAGAAAAAGLWTYQPLKLLPLLIVAWLWWLRRGDREHFGELRHTLPWLVAAYLAVAAPMGWAALQDPGNYLGRGAAVTAFNPDQGIGSLPRHVLRTLGMFALTGDPNPRHDVAALPLLGLPLLALALVGAAHSWRCRRDPRHSLVLAGLVVFLIPPLIATEGGSPHFLRSLGLAPYLAALVGMGCSDLVGWAGARRRWGPTVAIAACTAVLSWAAAGTAWAYFSRPVADRYDAYSFDLVTMAVLGGAGPRVAVIADDYAAFDVRFLDANHPPAVLDPGQRLAEPDRFSTILARGRGELTRVAGAAVAARARVVARDPQGRPSVWLARP